MQIHECSLKRIQVVAYGNRATGTGGTNAPVNLNCTETLQIPLGVNANLREPPEDGRAKIAEANQV